MTFIFKGVNEEVNKEMKYIVLMPVNNNTVCVSFDFWRILIGQ
jgi:hypothetical protein